MCIRPSRLGVSFKPSVLLTAVCLLVYPPQRSGKISDFNCKFAYLSFQLSVFVSFLLKQDKCIHTEVAYVLCYYVLYYYKLSSLSLVIPLVMKCTLSSGIIQPRLQICFKNPNVPFFLYLIVSLCYQTFCL